MKIAILTSPNQWFVEYAIQLQKSIAQSSLFFEYETIPEDFAIVFILSYHKLIAESYLKKHLHNLVIHASDLPKGKGWAPMFWQILEGKNEIPFTMFEASNGVDNGSIYMKKILTLSGFELNEALRQKQADFIQQMCLDFLSHYDHYKIPYPQSGDSTFYPKRSRQDSQLDIHKSIHEQFNLLRIVDNEEYPAFFEIEGHRYILKIESCS